MTKITFIGAAQLCENREHVYHTAMLDPRTAAGLGLRQIRRVVDDLITVHGDWMPEWLCAKPAA